MVARVPIVYVVVGEVVFVRQSSNVKCTHIWQKRCSGTRECRDVQRHQ